MVTISQILGYPTDELEPTILPSRLVYVTGLITEWQELKLLYTAAIKASGLVEVDGVKFDNLGKANSILMRLRGIENELSFLSGLPSLLYTTNPYTYEYYW